MATYTVKTGTLADSTAYGNKRNLARKSNSDLWCIYVRSDGTTQQIYCSYSTNDGETWTEEQVTSQTGAEHQYCPSMAIDSSDNIHIVWHGLGWGDNSNYRNIQYRKRTTSWQAQEAITDVAYNQYWSSIAIDSTDAIHIAWSGRGWGDNTSKQNIQYRKRTTSWQAQEAITNKNGHQYSPSVAIDSADAIHLAWTGEGWGDNTGKTNVQYRKRTTSWQAQEAVTDMDADQDQQSIAVDSNDNVHIVWGGWGWEDNINYGNIQYRERTTSWQTQEAVTDIGYDQYDPSIAIDSANNIHVGWYGQGWGDSASYYNIQYRKRTASWQTQEAITDRTYDNQSPVLIWALHPTISTRKTNRPHTGYALVWSGQDASGYKVEYFASDDLSWKAVAVRHRTTLTPKHKYEGIMKAKRKYVLTFEAAHKYETEMQASHKYTAKMEAK